MSDEICPKCGGNDFVGEQCACCSTRIIPPPSVAAVAVEFEFCEICNHPLSQCGSQDSDGEPTLDCVPCNLRTRIAELEEACGLSADVFDELDTVTWDDGRCPVSYREAQEQCIAALAPNKKSFMDFQGRKISEEASVADANRLLKENDNLKSQVEKLSKGKRPFSNAHAQQVIDGQVKEIKRLQELVQELRKCSSPSPNTATT